MVWYGVVNLALVLSSTWAQWGAPHSPAQSPGLAQPVRVPTATSLRAYALAWEKNMMYSPNFKSKHPPCELNFSFLSVYCLSVSTSKLMLRPINLIWLAHVDKHWSTAKIRCRLRSHLKSERKRIISGHSSKNDTENTAGDGSMDTSSEPLRWKENPIS